MAEWLELASQGHEMYCHDLEVMSSNPDQVELGVQNICLSCTGTKYIIYTKISVFLKQLVQISSQSLHT